MKLLSWNINGLRAVMKKDFTVFIKEHKPDILCLQEIKCQEKQIPNEFSSDPLLMDYKQYWSFAVRKGYSGVGILSKQEPISVSQGMGLKEADDEGRVLTLEYDDFFLVTAYFPNSQPELARLDFKLTFNKKFLSYIMQLKKKKNVVTCGDFNVAHTEIDLTHPKANEMNPGFYIDERNWFTSLIAEKNGFIDSFRAFYPKAEKQYTWWSYRSNARANNVGWRIDYFVINAEFMDRVRSAGILHDVLGSDHCPVSIELSD